VSIVRVGERAHAGPVTCGLAYPGSFGEGRVPCGLTREGPSGCGPDPNARVVAGSGEACVTRAGPFGRAAGSES
jgi:hypothetical protein